MMLLSRTSHHGFHGRRIAITKSVMLDDLLWSPLRQQGRRELTAVQKNSVYALCQFRGRDMTSKFLSQLPYSVLKVMTYDHFVRCDRPESYTTSMEMPTPKLSPKTLVQSLVLNLYMHAKSIGLLATTAYKKTCVALVFFSVPSRISREKSPMLALPPAIETADVMSFMKEYKKYKAQIPFSDSKRLGELLVGIAKRYDDDDSESTACRSSWTIDDTIHHPHVWTSFLCMALFRSSIMGDMRVHGKNSLP